MPGAASEAGSVIIVSVLLPMTSLGLPTITSTTVGLATPRATHRFYVVMATVVLATVLSGFGHSFGSHAPARTSVRVAIHASLFMTWVFLFVTQIALVSAGNVKMHRRLGVFGAALALVMIASAPPMAVSAVARGVFPNGVEFLLVILVDIALFAVFVGTAIGFRRRPEVHKRLMVLGMISMLSPAISRWPIAQRHIVVIPVVLTALIAATPVFDYLAGRSIRSVSLWGGLGIIVSIPVRFAFAQTPLWHHIAGWLIS